MKKTRLGIVLFALILAAGVAVSQSRTRRGSRPAAKTIGATPAPASGPSDSKRAVTINLREGDPIQGYFLRSDGDTVQIEVRSGNMSIRLGEIESMSFANGNDEPAPVRSTEQAPREAAATAEDPSITNARKAYVALRKLSDAAKISLPYPQYGNLIVETRSLIDQIVPALPENALKSEITATMDAYTDAGQAWGVFYAKDLISVRSEPGATLMKKYSIKPGVNQLGQDTFLPLDTTLSAIWNAAGARLRNVAMLVNQ